jgi:probable rRNA maturation factor
MIKIKNTQRTFKIDTKTLTRHASLMLKALKYDDFDLGIWFTTNKTIRHYNKTYRHKDKPTDVLSFPFYPDLKPGERIKALHDDEKGLGDLIISLEYTHKDAPNWGQSFEQRLDVLLAHGITHLLGYDHQTDEEFAQMQKVEKMLLKSLK